ncbi:hypothetical protein GCM10028895_51390 [Pontibacter rugosus]
MLVGANNAGKSTVIKALYKPQKEYSLTKPDIRKTKQEGAIAVRFAGATGNDFSLFQPTGMSEVTRLLPEMHEVTVLFCLCGAGEKKESYVYQPADERSVLQYHKRGKDENGRLVNLVEFTKLPDKESDQNFIYPFFAKRKHHHSYHHSGEDSMFQVHEDLSNLAAKIQNISNSSHYQNAEFDRLSRDILGFTVGLIPGEQHERKVGVFVDSYTTIPLESMGEGVLNVLGLIVILLTEDHKLFLIEELENDLHPAALKKLLDLIIQKAGSNQFVISTHSNIVVKYLGSVPDSNLLHITWQSFEAGVHKAIRVPTSQVKKVSAAPEDRMLLLQDLGYDLFDFALLCIKCDDMGEYTTAADDNLLGIGDKARLNELEAKGVLKAEEFILDLDFPVEVSTSLLLEIHKIAFGEIYEWAGTWRKKDLQVGTYAPPKFYDVPRLMAEFIYEMNKYWLPVKGENELVRLLPWVHHRMVHIPPLVNGNGRSSRLLTNRLAYMCVDQRVQLYQRKGEGRKNSCKPLSFLQAVKLADTHDYAALENMIREQLRLL